MNKYERHAEVKKEQEQTQLVNCALLAAYLYGGPGGWYCICKGSIDGFKSDYAVIHSNPGNLECHRIRAVYLEGSELPEYQSELEEILNAQEERPLVATVTEEETRATLQAIRDAAEEAEVTDLEEWLETLCKSGCSDVSFCNWSAVADAVNSKPNPQLN